MITGDYVDLLWVLYNPAMPATAGDAGAIRSSPGTPPRWRLAFIFAAASISLHGCSFAHLWYDLITPGTKWQGYSWGV